MKALLFIFIVAASTSFGQIPDSVLFGGGFSDEMNFNPEPSYPGGRLAMQKFLSDNINYPDTAKALGVSGVVNVEFTINETGDVINVKVPKSTHWSLDKEAIRVVKLMPNWYPATDKDGNHIAVPYSLPIRFVLQD